MARRICPSDAELMRRPANDMGAALVAHIASCPACHAKDAALRRLAAVGAALPMPPTLGGERAAVLRASIVARAMALAAPRRARRGWLVPVLAVAATLIAVALGLGFSGVFAPDVRERPAETAPPPPAYRATIVAHEGARFVRLEGPPDEIVRLFEGTLTVVVEPLGPGERFSGRHRRRRGRGARDRVRGAGRG